MPTLAPSARRFFRGALLTLAAGAAASTAAPADADLVIYTDEAAFNAALNGLTLTTEDFNEASDNFPTGTFQPFNAPLSSATSNAFFGLGEIAPGVTFGQLGGSDANGLAVVQGNAPGVGNYPSVALGTAQQGTTLDLLFSAGIGSLRFDGYTAAAASASLLIDVLDQFGIPLVTTQQITVANSGPGTFFGVISDDEDIRRVNLTVIGGFAGLDDLGFGPAPDPVAVPEPSAMLLLALSGLFGGGIAVRRRSAHKQNGDAKA